MATHKKYVRFIAQLVLALMAGRNYAQLGMRGLEIQKDTTTQPEGKTYALIVGISHYQYPACYPTLHYADADARELFHFMTAKKGGNVDPANVDTLFNEQATQENFWSKFNSIRIRLQKNDNFYVYFSGHGDAISTDLAYLLTYNAPPGNDRNNYYTSGGVVDIHTLKGLIRMITMDKNKPAHVILITDACRSNELPPGKEEGRQQFFDEMYTKNAGEIQLVSCLANQVSFEDAKWGGGRGLFSWHLVNGLRGMADNRPEDGMVTLKELITYVSDKVQEDSYDPTNKKYRQTPDYCCRDKDDVVLAHVDKPTKDQLAMNLKLGKSTADAPAYAMGKGVNLAQAMKDEGYAELFNEFIMAVNDDRLIEPEQNNAMYYLNQLLEKNIKPELKSDLKFTLSSSLMADVTTVMNTYLHASTNNNNYTYNYFMTAARKLRAFQSISDTLYYNPRDIKVNLLFLEGHANWHSTKSYELKYCLAKADSAIALKPQASFLYNLKGLMHINLGQYKEAEAALRKGIALAPNWLYPYHNLALTLGSVGKYDSALYYFDKALALDPNYQTTYEGIASLYAVQKKYDTAIYYCKQGLEKDPTDPHIWKDLGYYYNEQHDWKNSLHSYYQSMRLDSTAYGPYLGALQVHLKNYTSGDSVKYYVAKMINSDPENPSVYSELGNILYENNIDDQAIQMYMRSAEIDSMNAGTWYGAYRSYDRMKKYDKAANSLEKALDADPQWHTTGLYNALGLSYTSAGRYDKALEAFGNAIKLGPDDAVLYDNYAYVSLIMKDTATAEKYYRLVIQKSSKYYSAYYELAKILATHHANSEAMAMLDNAVKYGEYTAKELNHEPAFAGLKDTNGFKELLKKAKE